MAKWAGLAAAAIAVGMVGTAPAAQASTLLVDPGAIAGLTTVDFDNPTLADDAVVASQYAALGLTVGGSENLFASHLWTGAGADGAHVTSFNLEYTDWGSASGTWDFIFAAPVQLAGGYFEFNAYSSATFQALLGGVVVDSYTYYNWDCCSSPQFIGFNGISFDTLRLTGVTGDDFYADTLRFTTVSAIPEPSTWAMMLIGFGAIGFALRRGRAHEARLAPAA